MEENSDITSRRESDSMDRPMDNQEGKKKCESHPHAFCALYPFLTILRVLGVMYVKKDSYFNQLLNRKVRSSIATIGFAYCCITVVIQWFEFIR